MQEKFTKTYGCPLFIREYRRWPLGRWHIDRMGPLPKLFRHVDGKFIIATEETKFRENAGKNFRSEDETRSDKKPYKNRRRVKSQNSADAETKQRKKSQKNINFGKL